MLGTMNLGLLISFNQWLSVKMQQTIEVLHCCSLAEMRILCWTPNAQRI